MKRGMPRLCRSEWCILRYERNNDNDIWHAMVFVVVVSIRHMYGLSPIGIVGSVTMIPNMPINSLYSHPTKTIGSIWQAHRRSLQRSTRWSRLGLRYLRPRPSCDTQGHRAQVCCQMSRLEPRRHRGGITTTT